MENVCWLPVFFFSSEGDLSSRLPFRGSCRLTGGESISLKRQSTVNLVSHKANKRYGVILQLFSCHRGEKKKQTNKPNKKQNTHSCGRSLSVLRKKDWRSGGCRCLHSVPCSPGTERPAESACQIRSRGERGDLQVGGRSEALIIKTDRGQRYSDDVYSK